MILVGKQYKTILLIILLKIFNRLMMLKNSGQVICNEKSFRKDINGLRAFAVIPVLFFHSGLQSFRGGYLGVDVFFVISGYLIAQHIIESIDDGSFNFGGFYLKRARRILPLLVFVMAICTALAYLLMLPNELKNFGQSLTASALAANNILLYFTSGYWSLASEFKPLYHTWSLAVEEQFYMLTPIIIYLLFRGSRKYVKLKYAMIAFFLAGLTAFISTRNTELRYLSLHTRGWELLAGVLLAQMPVQNRTSTSWLPMIGIAMILFCYVAPGYLSIDSRLLSVLVVTGAVTVIYFCHNDDLITGRLLSARPLAFLGLISYGVYLWHQPIISFVKLAYESQPNPYLVAIISLASIPMAYLSWRFIENPFRRDLVLNNKLFLVAVVSVLGFFVLVGIILHVSYGLEKIKNSDSQNPANYVEQPRVFARSDFINNGKPKLLVVGNSFARDFINILKEAGLIEYVDIVYREGGCQEIENSLTQKLATQSNLVVLSENWGQVNFDPKDITALQECSSKLKLLVGSDGFIILGSKNFGWNNNFIKARLGKLQNSYRVKPLASVLEFDGLAKTSVKNYVSVLDIISTGEGVRIFDENGKLLTYDTNHLTPNGARFVGEGVIQHLSKRWPAIFKFEPLARLPSAECCAAQ